MQYFRIAEYRHYTQTAKKVYILKIAKFYGRLGNQMFHYAVALSVAHNDVVYLDLSFLKKQNKINGTILIMKNDLSIFPNLKFEEFKPSFLFNCYLSYPLIRNIFKKKLLIVKQKENELVSFNEKQLMYFDGYFQSEKYFLSIRNKILNVFSFPELDENNFKLKQKIKSYTNAVSIHIRRGDYLNENQIKYHGNLDLDYYNSAISIMKQKLENVHFFVFSDDIEYAKYQYTNSLEYTIIEGNKDYNSWKDMALMSFCNHHIVANSSFSWWGAWLSTSNGVKIAPKNWFNPEITKFEIDDIIPSSWIKI